MLEHSVEQGEYRASTILDEAMEGGILHAQGFIGALRGITTAYLADEPKVECRKGVHSLTDSPLTRWTLAWTRRRQVGECCQAGDSVAGELWLGI